MARKHNPPEGSAERASSGQLAALMAGAREKSGLTQQEAAGRARIALSTIRNVENGRSFDPGFSVIARLAAVFLDELAVDEPAAEDFRAALAQLVVGAPLEPRGTP